MRLLILPLILLLTGCQPPKSAESQSELSAGALLSALPPDGFARADSVRSFEFPKDHASHPEFRNEWWYFTGNLDSAQGRRFGYQVTFFRFSPQPPDTKTHPSKWANNPLWLAHVALTDTKTGRHLAEERLTRSGPGLAGAEGDPLRVWLQDWQLTAGAEGFPWLLDVDTQTFSLQLSLSPLTGVMLQGDRGLSQKSAEPGNASYYYSYPRMRTAGAIRVGDQTETVEGLSWFDREWSTSALSQEQVGWDWFSLQFNNGDNLMYYQLRNKDGSADPHSAGSLLKADGSQRRIDRQSIRLQPLSWWSADDGRRYPIEWQLTLLPEQRQLRILPVVDSQEMKLSFRYWEGAVDIQEKGEIVGRGYLEMTGY